MWYDMWYVITWNLKKKYISDSDTSDNKIKKLISELLKKYTNWNYNFISIITLFILTMNQKVMIMKYYKKQFLEIIKKKKKNWEKMAEVKIVSIGLLRSIHLTFFLCYTNTLRMPNYVNWHKMAPFYL